MNSSMPKALETAKTALWLRATASFLIFTLLWPSYAAAASTLLPMQLSAFRASDIRRG